MLDKILGKLFSVLWLIIPFLAVGIPCFVIAAPWWVILLLTILDIVLSLILKFGDLIEEAILWIWALVIVITSPHTIWSFIFYLLFIVWILRIRVIFKYSKE